MSDTTWNDIPFDENASPEVKAAEFDAQLTENGGDVSVMFPQGDEG